MAVLTPPVVLNQSASIPMAVLEVPVVLLRSALTPTAVLATPVVLYWRAAAPVAVLSWPVVLLRSANPPFAVLKLPVVLLKRANALLPRIIAASRVVQKRASACGRVFVCGIDKERTSANTRVEAAGAIAEERIQTKSSIISAGGEAQKSALSFSSVPTGVAAVRRWNYRLRF
jgi:hypothetical protein